MLIKYAFVARQRCTKVCNRLTAPLTLVNPLFRPMILLLLGGHPDVYILIRLRLMVIPFIQFHIAIVIIITIIIIIITVFNLRRVKRTKGNWEGVEKTAGHFFSWNGVKTFKNSRENLCSRALVFRLRYYQWECFWLRLKDLIQLASIPDPFFLIFWIYPWKRTLGSKYFV